ncbi:HmuY family protein [Hymenobacter mucosus]|uniref:HmuY protein n=1 Tax=Hymenobacter mucosus TaxID=1411120 RepID=A0A238Z8U2_9BACT|nr:HmuY family protein [Hymenobacter mucosus]SNR79391.1 HmuY protein [Hymenobacter mucosus]
MNELFSRLTLLAAVSATLGISACSNDDDDANEVQPAAALKTETTTNLAPMPRATNPTTGQPGTPKHYAFYNLATKSEVPYTDSATTKWDIAVRGTTILTNGGSSGPGQGGALVQEGLFAEIVAAPTTGYQVDSPTAKAITTGSGKGWYNYNSTTHIVTPIAGRVLLVRTATGKYAKLEIVSYYKDAPATPTGTEPSGYYTFRYVYQPNGSVNLK